MKKETQLQLVSFKQAIRLEIAGFNWETDKLYCKPFPNRPEYLIPNNAGITEHYLRSAPTVALALKWMRDAHNISGEIYSSASGWQWEINKGCKDVTGGTFISYSNYQGTNDAGAWDMYQDCESALLDELLTLIEK